MSDLVQLWRVCWSRRPGWAQPDDAAAGVGTASRLGLPVVVFFSSSRYIAPLRRGGWCALEARSSQSPFARVSSPRHLVCPSSELPRPLSFSFRSPWISLAIMMFKSLIAGMLPALLLSSLALAGPVPGDNSATKPRSKCRSNRPGRGKNSTVGSGDGYGGHSAKNRAFWTESFNINTDYERTMPVGRVRKVLRLRPGGRSRFGCSN